MSVWVYIFIFFGSFTITFKHCTFHRDFQEFKSGADCGLSWNLHARLPICFKSVTFVQQLHNPLSNPSMSNIIQNFPWNATWPFFPLEIWRGFHLEVNLLHGCQEGWISCGEIAPLCFTFPTASDSANNKNLMLDSDLWKICSPYVLILLSWSVGPLWPPKGTTDGQGFSRSWRSEGDRSQMSVKQVAKQLQIHCWLWNVQSWAKVFNFLEKWKWKDVQFFLEKWKWKHV